MRVPWWRSRLRPAVGSIDALTVGDTRVLAYGWAFDNGRQVDRVEALLDGRTTGSLPQHHRPDVDAALSWSSTRARGFLLDLEVEEPLRQRVDFVAWSGRRRIGRLSCLVPLTVARYPMPPDHLAERVSGATGEVVRLQGLRMFTDLEDQLQRLPLPPSPRLLDWGCGCGRVAEHFLERRPDAALTGCDIDAEAIAWCRDNLAGSFLHVDPLPPLPLPAASVDVVIACSVFTHMERQMQERWLQEIRRILVPGGHLLASVHGEFAFRRSHPDAPVPPPGRWDRLVHGDRPAPALAEILDTDPDHRLDAVAPAGYYRSTFQSRQYTVGLAKRHFKVIDYLESGLCGHQDLIVLRRRRGS